jgi:acetylornithine/N-succinyldiaminopimelate aminotransferase
MNSQQIKELYAENVMETYARFDVVLDRGEGATLYSPEGKAYVDFTSGIGVNSIGYGNRGWAEAIMNQAVRLQHVSNLYYTEPGARLAEALTKGTGMKKAFFSNSGAESNEGAIKLARKYARDKYGPGRETVITLERSFHGRTITTLAATGQDVFHQHFFPFTEGFRHIPANDFAALEAELGRGDVCAVMMELVQGEGGVLPLDKEYVSKAFTLCREKDVLLICDEVQTGIGRTGSLFAFQQFDIQPDVVTFAKGIAGGLPMGGILANHRCAGVLTAGTHATTFGGNPVCAAAALYVLDTLTPQLLENVTHKGEYIRKTIESWSTPAVSQVRGMGLMIGVSLKGIKPADVVGRCIEKGLLVLTAGSDALRLLPPLTISHEETEKGLALLKSVLEELQ